MSSVTLLTHPIARTYANAPTNVRLETYSVSDSDPYLRVNGSSDLVCRNRLSRSYTSKARAAASATLAESAARPHAP